MKKALIAICIVVCILAIPVGMWYFFEVKQDEKVTEVSTFEQLKTAKDNVKLINDIDGNYETISSISCASFDDE